GATADKKINQPVAVKIGRQNAGSRTKSSLEIYYFVKISFAVVQVNALPHRLVLPSEFITAGSNRQIQIAILVYIRKNSVHIFKNTVANNRGGCIERKFPARVLQIQRRALLFGRTKKHIVQTIAIYVAHSKGRPLATHHIWNQQLPVELYKIIFFMTEINTRLRCNVLK